MIDYLKRGIVIYEKDGKQYEMISGDLVRKTADIAPLSDRRRRVKYVSWALLTYVEKPLGKDAEVVR